MDEPNQFFVPGTPRPQGSKKPLRNKYSGRISLVEQSGAKLKAWRSDVRTVAEKHCKGLITGPVSVWLNFEMPRPKKHFGTGRNANTRKAAAPNFYHTQTPDIDKLTRSVLDALTGVFFADDSQVAAIVCTKSWSTGRAGGVSITVREL